MPKSGLQQAIESVSYVTDTVDREGSSFEVHVEDDTMVEELDELVERLPALMFVSRVEPTADGTIIHCLQYEEAR